MENNVFNVPMDMSSQNSLITGGTFSHLNMAPLSHSSSLDPNNQNPFMSGLPVLSMLQGEPINDLHSGLQLPNRTSITNPNEVHDQFMAGMPISASSLATLLATRYSNPHENLNDIVNPAPFTHPEEVLKPNDYSDTFRSSFGTAPNFGGVGMMGDMSSKWGFDKFLAPLELARTGYQPFQLMGTMDPNGSDSPGSSRFSNELSLSLATCQPTVIHGTAVPDQELSCSGLSSHSLPEQQLGSAQTWSNSKNLSLGFGSFKPVQYSELLSGSGYIQVMQEILAEIASYLLENHHPMSYQGGGIGGGAHLSFSSSCSAGRSYKVMDCDELGDGDDQSEVQIEPSFMGREVEAKKKHMLALLEAVCC